MKKFIGKRFIHLVTVLIGISFLSFILINISPTDPAEAYARRITKAPTDEMIERYREEFGFNRPIPEQYFIWIKNAVQMDFGMSYTSGKPAMQTLLASMPATLILAGLACLQILVFAVPLGFLSAYREGTWADKCIMGLSFFSISMPSYFFGLLCLLVFGVWLKIMPVVGHGHPVSMLCASFVIAFPMLGSLCRIFRSLLLENRSSDYVLYAKARGISRRKVMANHLLRGAAPPCIVMFGQNIGYLLAGTAIVENIFSTRGMGQVVLDAALNRDFPVINTYIVLMALCFVFCNTVAEGAGILLNPALAMEDKK